MYVMIAARLACAVTTGAARGHFIDYTLLEELR